MNPKKILRMGLRARDFNPELTKSEVLERKWIIEQEIQKKLNSSSLGSLSLDVVKRKGKSCYIPKLVSQACLLSYLNAYMGWVYKVRVNNRNEVIRCLKAHMQDTSPLTIFRTDIYKFYESVDRTFIKNEVLSSKTMPEKTKHLFIDYFRELERLKIQGLPRGIGLSGSMSEMYLSDFDRKCRSMEDVIFFARYVDDIIVIFLGDKKESDIKKQIEDNLENHAHGLKIKNKKTKFIQLKRVKSETKPFSPFDFLGYSFEADLSSDEEDTRNIKISLSERKLNDYKRKISAAFISFKKSNNTNSFSLLEQRIKYLTGNIYLPNDKDNRALKSGIYYNYPELSSINDSGLEKLDSFLKMIIFSSNCRVVNASSKLSYSQKKALAKYSFKTGYENKFTTKLSVEELVNISRVFK